MEVNTAKCNCQLLAMLHTDLLFSSTGGHVLSVLLNIVPHTLCFIFSVLFLLSFFSYFLIYFFFLFLFMSYCCYLAPCFSYFILRSTHLSVMIIRPVLPPHTPISHIHPFSFFLVGYLKCRYTLFKALGCQ